MNQTKWYLVVLLLLPLSMIGNIQDVHASGTEIQIIGKLKGESSVEVPSLPNSDSENRNSEGKETIIKDTLPNTGERNSMKMNLMGVLLVLLLLSIKIHPYIKKAY